jgi:Bacterial regulatory protein, Fis family
VTVPLLQLGATLDDVIEILRESGMPYADCLLQFEKRWIEQVLESCGGIKLRAARELGVNRNTLERWIQDLHIAPRHGRRPARATKLAAPKGGAGTSTEANADLSGTNPGRATVTNPGRASFAGPSGLGGVNSATKGELGESQEPEQSVDRSHVPAGCSFVCGSLFDCGGDPC